MCPAAFLAIASSEKVRIRRSAHYASSYNFVDRMAVWVAECDDDVDPICDRIQLAAFA